MLDPARLAGCKRCIRRAILNRKIGDLAGDRITIHILFAHLIHKHGGSPLPLGGIFQQSEQLAVVLPLPKNPLINTTGILFIN